MSELTYGPATPEDDAASTKQERAPCGRRARLLGKLGVTEMAISNPLKDENGAKTRKYRPPKAQKLDVFVAYKGARLYPVKHFDQLVEKREKIRHRGQKSK